VDKTSCVITTDTDTEYRTRVHCIHM